MVFPKACEMRVNLLIVYVPLPLECSYIIPRFLRLIEQTHLIIAHNAQTGKRNFYNGWQFLSH
jgi:hypothetical protein